MDTERRPIISNKLEGPLSTPEKYALFFEVGQDAPDAYEAAHYVSIRYGDEMMHTLISRGFVGSRLAHICERGTGNIGYLCGLLDMADSNDADIRARGEERIASLTQKVQEKYGLWDGSDINRGVNPWAEYLKEA